MLSLAAATKSALQLYYRILSGKRQNLVSNVSLGTFTYPIRSLSDRCNSALRRRASISRRRHVPGIEQLVGVPTDVSKTLAFQIKLSDPMMVLLKFAQFIRMSLLPWMSQAQFSARHTAGQYKLHVAVGYNDASGKFVSAMSRNSLRSKSRSKCVPSAR